MPETQEFLTYVNGQVMPHSQAYPILQRINEHSAGGYYDAARTFSGKPFKLRQHIERLFNGLAHSKIDPGISLDDLETASLGIVEANYPLMANGTDEMTVTQIVTITRPSSADDVHTVNVAIYCMPLDFTSFARSYIDGVRIYTPSTYSPPQDQGTSDGKGSGPQTFPLMSNSQGNITECQGANFMFVSDGRIRLPDRRNVLPGVSMQTVLELAESIGVEVDEGLYNQRHIYEADEAFVSSTRYCLLPVATLNGYSIGDAMPGEVTTGLLSRWKERVGVDFVQQALASLP